MLKISIKLYILLVRKNTIVLFVEMLKISIKLYILLVRKNTIVLVVEMLKISIKLYILIVRKNTIFVKKIQEHSIFGMESSNLLDIYVC
jgi:hypothetical protein